MFVFICNNCKKTKQLSKSILTIENGKVKTKNARCICGEEMQEVEKKATGFPTLIRTEPTLTKK